jgi:2-aminoadipate transaminase
MVYEFLTKYNLDDYIKENRKLYAHRCSVMIEAMKEHFPKQVTYTEPKGGLFIWCDMHGDYDTKEVAKECMKEKVVFVPGSTFMVDMEAKCSAFRLNFSTMTDERIVEGIKILGKTLKKIMGE